MELLERLFVNIAGLARTLMAGWSLPNSIIELVVLILGIIAIIGLIIVDAIILVWLERKIAGFIQERPGPNRLGPAGVFQTIADTFKLLGKEDVIPRSADRWVFRLAPPLVFVPAIMLYAVIPFGKDMVPVDLNVGLFYCFSIASLGTMSFLMAGWGSHNKYSLLGGMRTVAQMISYEIPLLLSVLGVVMIVGSLNLSDIVAAQKNVWFIIIQPVAFIIYLIAATAELNRGPFDLPEGEQELVAGVYTEFSGMRWALFFLAEYTNMVATAAIAVTLFFGGWHGPWLPSWMWFFLKVYLIIFFFMVIKWTYPRIRVDHLMHFGWKFLIPLSLANLLLTGVGIEIYRFMRG
ncbi:MAG: NADH-quinone oxidoreductase subunit NuoH [Syntrophomonadaceae bacterium]|nr:NADH-quinone oxidoreductase subunit NuoH [Syntrophomonadaceae bacterium]